jgi:hypothetical protein
MQVKVKEGIVDPKLIVGGCGYLEFLGTFYFKLYVKL